MFKIKISGNQESLGSRISFSVLAVAGAIFLAALVVVMYYSNSFLIEDAKQNVSNQLTIAASSIDHNLLAVETAIENNEWLVMNSLDDEEKLYEITRKIVSDNEEICGCAIAFKPYYFQRRYFFSPYSYVGADSLIYSKQLGTEDYDYQFMDWFQIPFLLRKPVWSEPYFDEGGADVVMATYSYPLIDTWGDVFAVMTADYPLTGIVDLVNQIHPYENSFAFLVSRNGTYVAHKDTSLIFTHTVLSNALDQGYNELYEAGLDMLNSGIGYREMRMKGEGNKYLSYMPLHNKWSMAIVNSDMDVLGRSYIMLFIIIALMVFGLVLLYIFTRQSVKKKLQPLVLFTEAANEVAKGDFKYALPEVKTKDEMRTLRDSFAYMQDSIVKYIADLKETMGAKERIESELRIAADIQRGMVPSVFPPFPERNDLDIFAVLSPAKEVGGDLYDYFIRDNKFYFTIGDVSGKGVPAAIFMAIARSAFRYIGASAESASDLMTKLNDSISQGNQSNMFITMFAGILDLATGDIQFCNAGHNPGVLISPDGKAEYVEVKNNLVVGVMDGFPFSGQSMKIERGSTLLLYTDGVTEAENSVKELYSEERLQAFCSNNSFDTGEELIGALVADIKKFTNGEDQNDDITILTIKLK